MTQSTPGIYLREKKALPSKDKHRNTQNGGFFNSSMLEASQMSINRWMDKQTVVYWHSGILASNRKEQTTDTHRSMKKSLNSDAGWKKLDQKRVPLTWLHLCEVPENANWHTLTEAHQRLPGGGEWEAGGTRKGLQRITTDSELQSDEHTIRISSLLLMVWRVCMML